MPKFLVPVTRDCTETTVVDVEAETVEKAVALAVGEVRQRHWEFSFTPDDGSGFEDPYFAGDDDYEAVEEVEP